MNKLQLPYNSLVIFGDRIDFKVTIPTAEKAAGSVWYAVTSEDGKRFNDIRKTFKGRNSESSGDDFSILHESIAAGASEISVINLETGEVVSYEAE